MTRRRRRLWLGAAALLALASGGLWLLAPGPPEVPASTLFPPTVSAAVRLKDFGKAYARHWESRGADEWDSLRKAMIAAGVWEDWAGDEGDQGEEGEAAARKRLGRARDIAFHLLGKETWVVLGEWPGEGGGAPETALLVLVQRDSILKARLAPLVEMMLPDAATKKTEHRGTAIYVGAADESKKAAIAWANVGGWICGAFAARSGDGAAPAPLRRMIDQLADARERKKRGEKIGGGEIDRFERDPALGARIHPSLLEGQYEALRRATGDDEEAKPKKKKRKEKEKDVVRRWAERLEGVESVAISQAGATLLDLDIQMKGARILGESIFAAPAPQAVLAIDAPTTPAASLGPAIVQMDFTRPFAAGAGDFFGFDWDEILEAAEDFEWVQPGFAPELRKRLAGRNGEGEREREREGERTAGALVAERRIGFALYPNHEEPLPASAIWADAAPLLRADSAPADAWRVSAPAPPDAFAAFAPVIYTIKAAPALAAAKRAFADALWREGPTPPLAFLCVHFDDLAESMRAFPAIVIKKKEREDWLQLCSMAEAAQAVAGSVAARLDRQGDDLVLSIRALPAAPK